MTRLLNTLFLAIMILFPFQKKHKICRLASDFELPHTFSNAIYFTWTDLLLIGFIAISLYSYRRQILALLFSGPAKYLTLLIPIALFSLTQSSSPSYLLHYIRVAQFALPLLFFLCVTFHYRNTSFSLAPLLWIFFATALVQGGVAIAQYFLQHPLHLQVCGEGDLASFRFGMATGERWVFDPLFGTSTGTDYLLRSCGTFDHPNVFGGYLFFSLMITSYLYLNASRCKHFVQCALFFLIFALCTTFSRSALFAFVLSSALWCALLLIRHKWIAPDPQIKRALSLFLTLGCSTAICLGLFYAPFFQRGGIVNYNAQVQFADGERVAYQKMAYEMAKESPLLGVGFNQFQIHALEQGRPAHLFSKVHNIYLLILAEMGIAGLTTFLLFLFSLFKRVSQGWKQDITLLLFSLFIGLLFIGGCDFYLLEGQKPRLFFWIAAALLSLSTYRAYQLESAS